MHRHGGTPDSESPATLAKFVAHSPGPNTLATPCCTRAGRGIEALLKPLVTDPTTAPSITPALPLHALPLRSAAQQTALDALRNDLAPHAPHLNYAERLRERRSIGSGQIEGACKNMIGRRRTANAARWRTRRVNRMAGLCSPPDSDPWNTYWQTT